MAKGSGAAAKERRRAEEACAEHAYLRPVTASEPLRFDPELRTAAELAGSELARSEPVAETTGALSPVGAPPA